MAFRSSKIQNAACVALLFAVNAFICRRMFFAEYLSQLGSGDGPQIAMARLVMDHPADMAWWPWWFCGMPHRNVYGPVVHMLVAAVATVAHLSPALTLHTMAALFYSLGPVTLYGMAWNLSGS